MFVLYAITALLVALSLLADLRKTVRAFGVALRRFLRVVPGFVIMLVLVAVVLYLVPDHLMVKVLTRENRWLGMASAVGIGSVSVMPGFIAFPLCGILLDRGALYMVLSAFSTTMMIVGVATFPLERAYLGTRLAFSRNVVSLGIAIAVALATGIFFGELP
ncbi:MAG: hypothetical protein ACC628_08975 [Pirellulaceae bacterium]